MKTKFRSRFAVIVDSTILVYRTEEKAVHRAAEEIIKIHGEAIDGAVIAAVMSEVDPARILTIWAAAIAEGFAFTRVSVQKVKEYS